MRRIIGSIVIGSVLVLALTVFADTSMAFRPDAGDGGITRPPALDQARTGPILPIGGADAESLRKNVNLKGTIDQLPADSSTGTWWIRIESGEVMSVEVTDQTRIVPPKIEPEEEDAVHVLARREGSGDDEILVAKQIVIKKAERKRARPIHIHGEIEHLPTPTGTITGTWVVNGISVTVDAETRLHPRDRMPELGMWANVLGLEQGDGTVLAQKITLQSRREAESDVEFEGPIQSLPEDESFLGTWVVDEISVTVTETTQLRGVTPTVGLNAEVEGELQEDESVLAHRIKVERPKQEKVEFEGTVVATDTIPGEWVIETQTDSVTEEISVTVTLSTCVNESKGRLELGAWVEVKAVERPDGTLEAIHIKVADGPDGHMAVEFTGIISQLPPSAPNSLKGHWTIISGTPSVSITVIVNGQTELAGGEPQEGETVLVEGVLQRDGLVKADRITVIASPGDD
jgi:hypothetical protein